MQGGYARSDSDSEYPNIRRYMLGAWCPGMQHSGNRCHDFRNGFDATHEGAPTWVPGLNSVALSLDGSSDHLEITDNILPFIDTGDDISIFALLSTNSITGDRGTILCTRGGGSNGWWFGYESSGELGFRSAGNSASATNNLLDNTYHAVGVTRATDDSVIFYEDGFQSGTGSTNAAGTSSLTLTIGRDPSSTRRIEAKIELVYLFNHVMDASVFYLLNENPYAPFVRRRRVYGLSAPAAGAFPPNSLALAGVGR
jgi:hypothetical protein